MSQTLLDGTSVLMTVLQKGTAEQIKMMFDRVKELPDKMRAKLLSQCTKPVFLGGNVLTMTLFYMPSLMSEMLSMVTTLSPEQQEMIFSDLVKYVLAMMEDRVEEGFLSYFLANFKHIVNEKQLPIDIMVTALSQQLQGKNLWQWVCDSYPQSIPQFMPLILTLPAKEVAKVFAVKEMSHQDKTPLTDNTVALMNLINEKSPYQDARQAYQSLAFCLDGLQKKKVFFYQNLADLYEYHLRQKDMSVDDFVTKWRQTIDGQLPQLLERRLPMTKLRDIGLLIAKSFYCLTVIGACHLVHKGRAKLTPAESQQHGFFKVLKHEVTKSQAEAEMDDLKTKVRPLPRS